MFEAIRKRATSLGVIVIFGIIILVFIFSGVSGMMGQSGVVVAEVNGESISVYEYSRRLSMFLQQPHPLLANVKSVEDVKKFGIDNMLLDEMIRERLLVQYAEKLGLSADEEAEEAVKKEIASERSFSTGGEFDREKLKAWLDKQGLTWGDLVEERRRPLLAQKLMDYIALSADVTPNEARRAFDFLTEERKAQYLLFPLAEYEEKITPSDEQINSFYQANQAALQAPARLDVSYLLFSPENLVARYAITDKDALDFYNADGKGLLTTPAKYSISHILVREPSGEAPTDVEEKKAAEIALKIKNGENFEELAKAESHDRISAEAGGELGTIEIGGNMYPEYAEALHALKVGEVSAPVRTDGGVFLIRLNAKTEAVTPSFDEAKEEIKRQLALRAAGADLDNIRLELQTHLDSGKSLEDLAGLFGLEVQNSGLIAQSRVLASLKLPEEGSQILTDTAEGALVAVPLDTEDGHLVVKVNQVKPEGVLPLEEVREYVVAAIKHDEGLLLARKAATDAMPDFEGQTGVPGKWKDKITESDSFDRTGVIAGLGSAANLVEALFAARKDQWLNAPYDTPSGIVLARVTGITKASETAWDDMKADISENLKREKQLTAVLQLIESLRNKAKIDVNTAAMEAVLKGNRTAR